MHRLLVSAEALDSDVPLLSSDAARHLKVLRPESGERVELFDGAGRSRIFAYGAAMRRLVAIGGEVVKQVPRPAPLTLFACVTKGSRWDWTIEKVTELGVTRIVPVISDRTIVRIPKEERMAKRDRWQRIAEDAARQSDAMWLPEILPAVDFRDSLALVRETTCFVGALTNPPPPSLASAIHASLALSHSSLSPLHSSLFTLHFSLFIGPEGDFTPDEMSQILEIAKPTSFGPTILRAETAAIFAVSVCTALTRGHSAQEAFQRA